METDHDDKGKSSFLEQNTEFPTLSFDNWEIIAGYLSLPDLRVLADVCTNARQAARLIFTRKYGSTKCILYIMKRDVEIETVYSEFGQHNAKCLKFLRIFGDLISELNLYIIPKICNNRLQQLIEYINQFTAQSRKKMILNEHSSVLIENPLQNLDEIQFQYCYDSSVTEFKALVTESKNVSSLQFSSEKQLIFLKQNLPQVTKLEIFRYKLNLVNGKPVEDLVQVMRLNPQIQKLKCSPFFKLKLNGTEMELLVFRSFEPILIKLIRPEQFEKVCLQWNCNENFVGFVKNLVNLKFLTMLDHRENAVEMINNIPKLETLQICNFYDIEFETANRILLSAAAHSKLSIVSFHFEDIDERETILAEFNRHISIGTWSIALNENGPKEFKYSVVFNRIPSQ